jgi:hypothetical protein
MNFRVIEFERVDWIYLAPDRDRCLAVLNTVIHLLIP